MRVKLSIIHAPAPLASPAWLAVNISQVSVGRDAQQRLQDRNAGSLLFPRAPDQRPWFELCPLSCGFIRLDLYSQLEITVSGSVLCRLSTWSPGERRGEVAAAPEDL